MKQFMQAGKFKSECLKVMETVKSTGKEVVITKRHIPIVKLCPIEKKDTALFGKMKGTVHEIEDLIQPISESWNADN